MMEQRTAASNGITAVVLAAGRSSRMGRAKQLVLVDGQPMVLRAAQVALTSKVDHVIVVTGAYHDAVTATLQSLLQTAGERLQLVYNPTWATGQASSVRAAVQALPTPCRAVLFLPTDQPFVPVTLLDALVTAWQAGARLAAPTVDGQPRGAPALFDRSLWAELLALEGDAGARPLLQRHRTELVTVPADAQWLQDIDTPEDLPGSPISPDFVGASPDRGW